MTEIFLSIGFILLLATAFALVAKRFNQPLLVGYIAAGTFVGSLGLFHSEGAKEFLDFLATFGIAFLLFLVGLELRFSDIKTYGKIALFTGIGQVIFTTVVGFVLLKLIGFSTVSSIYISIALAFSSTIIVVKLLTEKRDLDSLYGKISVGFLLVQDAVAIVALVLVSAMSRQSLSVVSFLGVFFNAFLLVGALLLLNRFLIPTLISKASKSIEILFVLSVGWAILMASLAATLGLSFEIGAFLAGISLANLKEEHQIASKVRPLRDLFIVFFFLVLGLNLTFGSLLGVLLPAIFLSLFILIGNPLILLLILGRLGFRKRTAFFTSLTVAQISEFSLILVTLGLKAGDLSQEVVNLVTAVALITIVGSSYMILHNRKLYKVFEKYLNFFESENPLEEVKFDQTDFNNHVILVGAGRLGSEILKRLVDRGEEVVVVDFNPNMVSTLKDKGHKVLFGDITDPEIVEAVRFDKAKFVISTIFDPEETSQLLKEVKAEHLKVPIIVTAATVEWAKHFYQKGADYVVIPRVLSGQQMASMLTSQRKIEEIFSGETRREHMEELREIGF